MRVDIVQNRGLLISVQGRPWRFVAATLIAVFNTLHMAAGAQTNGNSPQRAIFQVAREKSEPERVGTAFLVDRQGYVMTAAHVLSECGTSCILVLPPNAARFHFSVIFNGDGND